MTEEEMNQKIAEAKDELAEAKKEIEDLKTQRSNQNSYITKLEGKVKGYEAQAETVKQAVNSAPAIAPEITEYFQKMRREDYYKQASEELKTKLGEDKFNCLEPELKDFLKLYMNEKNVSVRYIIDSFHLLLGRALANPEHPIHNVIGDNKKVEETPVVEEKPATEADQDLFRQNLNNMINRTMTNDDMNTSGAPEVKAPTVVNTQDAMKKFKDKLLNLDSSKFE